MAEAVKKISVNAVMLKNNHTLVRVSVKANFSSKVSSFRITKRNLFFRFLFLLVFILSAISFYCTKFASLFYFNPNKIFLWVSSYIFPLNFKPF
jgi:hypothetical protein